MRKILCAILTLCLTTMCLGALAADFDTSREITVVSREDGSGTRGAFIELTGVEEKDASGQKIDMTTEEAIITNATSVMMTTVSSNPYAIGYISLGSMNDTVKALAIDGATPSAQAVKDGSYAIARPFNIVTLGEANAQAQDFIDFILSAEGQRVIEDNGYIAASGAPAFSGGTAQGRIVVAGSSSVTPVMEKLTEAYKALNPGLDIEIQMSDSTTGVNAALEGVCQIGMASRALKDSELEKGAVATPIAMDGIAVIVNNSNPLNALTTDDVKDIFTGAVTEWAGIGAQ